MDELISEVFSEGKLLIDQNLKVNCDIDEKEFARAYSQKVNGRYQCVLKPLDTKSANPNSLHLTVTVSSNAAASY